MLVSPGISGSTTRGDIGQVRSPLFPPSDTPDFLSSLSQISDGLLVGEGGASHPRTPGSNPRTPAEAPICRTLLDSAGQPGHPRTPMEGQMCQQPRTPMDNQLSHPPRTPIDNQMPQVRTPVDGQHPRTPLDNPPSQSTMLDISGGINSCDSGVGSGGGMLRHPSSGPGTPGSLGNPRTPASCGSSHRLSGSGQMCTSNQNPQSSGSCQSAVDAGYGSCGSHGVGSNSSCGSSSGVSANCASGSGALAGQSQQSMHAESEIRLHTPPSLQAEETGGLDSLDDVSRSFCTYKAI